MSRIHITKAGKPAACKAKDDNCPLGGKHYDNMDEASLAVMEQGAGVIHDKPAATVEELERKAKNALTLANVADTRQEETALRNEHAQLKREADALRATQQPVGRTVAPADEVYPSGSEYERWTNESVGFTQEDADAAREASRLHDTSEDETPYTEDEVYALAVDELVKSGLISEGWTVSFGQRTRALGTCYYEKKQIEFSKLWFPIMSKTETRDVVTHEVSHAMVGHGEGHSEKWQQQHRALGGTGDATYDGSDEKVRDGYKERFKKFYPNGVHFGTRGGVAKKELDPAMIEALKFKYLKKFKMPFDESGLSIPELLQMAQKGELD